jgi:peptide/nickel transport system substrate-binding protein
MRMRYPSRREAIGRAAIVGIVVVIIILGAAAGIYLISSSSKTTTSTTSTTTSSGSPSSSTTSTTGSATTGTNSTSPSTLVMDDENWPIDNLNVLNFVGEVPWPSWWEYSVYEPLVVANITAEYQSGTVSYLPVLAQNYTITNDNTTYTFNLRDNVTFSNGDPFNAYQVWGELYGFYYLSGNSSGWWQSYQVFNMTGVDFGPSTLNLMSQSGLVHPNAQLLSIMENKNWPIYVTSADQIVFQLDAPFLYFLGAMNSYVGMTFDTQFVLNNGGFGNVTAFNPAFNTLPIPGTGPYEITGNSINAYVKFGQNPTYWGKNLSAATIKGNVILDPGHVANVVVNYVSDDLSRYTALSSGSAQIAAISTSANWNQITSDPSKYGYTLLPSWSADVSAISLNTNEYPTNITAVRQAIVNAINYTDIIQTAFYGQMAHGMGPEYPLYTQYYDLGNLPAYNYDPSNATAILKAANINPASLPPLVFRTIASCSYCIEIAQIVQADLESVGFQVQISELSSTQYYVPYGSYSTNVQNNASIGQMSLLGGSTWAPSALTPADNWVSFVSNDSSWGNWAGFNNAAAQACVNIFTHSSSVAQIQAACTKAQQAIYTQAPYAWIGYAKLWYYSGSIAYNKNVISGFALDPNWNGIDTMPLINTVTFVDSS